MYTTKSSELITRAGYILDLIYKANDRIDELQQRIYELTNVYATFEKYEIEKLEAVKTRLAEVNAVKEKLVKRYGAVLLRIIYNGLKQGVFEHLDAPSVALKP
jgi:hypothetical protein